MEQQKQRLIESIAALKGIAKGIAAAVDAEEQITGDEIYQMLMMVADYQAKIINTRCKS